MYAGLRGRARHRARRHVAVDTWPCRWPRPEGAVNAPHARRGDGEQDERERRRDARGVRRGKQRREVAAGANVCKPSSQFNYTLSRPRPRNNLVPC
mgnify:CR=1 FL=1